MRAYIYKTTISPREGGPTRRAALFLPRQWHARKMPIIYDTISIRRTAAVWLAFHSGHNFLSVLLFTSSPRSAAVVDRRVWES